MIAEGGVVRYFILQQREDRAYEWDEEGAIYHFTPNASGAWKKLASSEGARFVYYRPGSSASDGTARCYFGAGQIDRIDEEKRNGERHFIAHLADYERFLRPVPASEFDPRPNVQMAIAEISAKDYQELVRRGQEMRQRQPLTLAGIRSAAEARGLLMNENIYASALAALEAGKHLVFTGPPGTGKTTLAEAIASAAADAGLCNSYVLTTATADWTTYETIGGLKPSSGGELAFEEGHFLSAVRNGSWLVIDELNRSNFDRAFGQLFTVLSGQAVELPYEHIRGQGRIALVPEGAEPPSRSDVLPIPPDWRVLATMNVFDKTLLFEMSFALMRRFAFIEVPAPAMTTYETLIESESGHDAATRDLAARLLPLRRYKELGPAVFIDLTRFIRQRRELGPVDEGQLAFDAFYAYMLPQFEGIDAVAGERLHKFMRGLVGTGLAQRLTQTLNDVLGLELIHTRDETEVDGNEDAEGIDEVERAEETGTAEDLVP